LTGDARWFDVEAEVADAVDHFTKAVELYELGGFEDLSLRGYQASMALMHAMQSGHTSLEGALVRILTILEEAPPSGERWHEDLVRRAGASLSGELARPAILPPEVVRDVEETRRFRNKAARGYNSFDPARARPALEAASRLAFSLQPAISRFRASIDPGRVG
jgi:hypothetical protein